VYGRSGGWGVDGGERVRSGGGTLFLGCIHAMAPVRGWGLWFVSPQTRPIGPGKDPSRPPQPDKVPKLVVEVSLRSEGWSTCGGTTFVALSAYWKRVTPSHPSRDLTVEVRFGMDRPRPSGSPRSPRGESAPARCSWQAGRTQTYLVCPSRPTWLGRGRCTAERCGH